MPPVEKIIEVDNDSLRALNRWTEKFPNTKALIEWDGQVVRSFPDARRRAGGPDSLSIRSTQHCELTVALHLLQLRTPEGSQMPSIEVGCSKASCFWCHKYINELNSVLILSGPVVVRATHGKMTNEWMVPQAAQGFEDECNRAKQNVFDTIGKSIRAIFAAGSDLRRKSDSQPLGASGHPRSKAMLQEERLEKPLFGSA